jgi:hypothetical protein
MKRLLKITGLIFIFSQIAWAATLGETKSELGKENPRIDETALGGLITESIRNSAKTDIAVIHALAFRDGVVIPSGEVDEQDIRHSLALPTDKICTMKLTPNLLFQVMERALTRYPGANPAFLQFNGMDVEADYKLPAGHRVTAILMSGDTLNLDDIETNISVAMPQTLAKGAVGYYQEFNDLPVTVLETTLLEAVKKEFARQQGSVDPEVGQLLLKGK